VLNKFLDGLKQLIRLLSDIDGQEVTLGGALLVLEDLAEESDLEVNQLEGLLLGQLGDGLGVTQGATGQQHIGYVLTEGTLKGLEVQTYDLPELSLSRVPLVGTQVLGQAI
jgi:hypothetical protein